MGMLREELRAFIVDAFLFHDGASGNFTDQTSFVDNRIIDSTGVLELVAFLEKTYGIRVEDEELDPENLDSIDRLVGFVERKRGARS